MKMEVKRIVSPFAKTVRQLMVVGAMIGTLLGVSTPLSAQVLTVAPSCGRPGDSVTIGGSGWAVPEEPCDYLFYFDGAEFAPRQPDSFSGPPNRVATVPNNFAGDYIIKVENRLNDGSLVQCRQTGFRVVDKNLDPFADANIQPPPGGHDAEGEAGLVVFSFDPRDVCDVPLCSTLVWIQSVKLLGVKADLLTTQELTHAEMGWIGAAADSFDDDVINGVNIDRAYGRPLPYYGSDIDGNPSTNFKLQEGIQSEYNIGGLSFSRPANMFDRPNSWKIPVGFAKVRGEFESNVFCAEGQSKGTFPGGKVTWEWESNVVSDGTAVVQSRTGTSTVVSATRAQPSQAFLDALAKWDTNHASWEMPTPSTQTPTGEKCP